MNAVTSLPYPIKGSSLYGDGVSFPAGWDEASSVWRSGAALLFVLAVGTGGQCNWQFIQRRQTLGYPVANVEVRERVHAYPIRTAAAGLKQARVLFGVSVSDLAALFGVTRQTIYDWLGGEQQPREGHQARMAALLGAAGRLEAAGFRASRRALKQPLRMVARCSIWYGQVNLWRVRQASGLPFSSENFSSGRPLRTG